MQEMTLPMEGGCLCGAVRVRASKAPLITLACHCTQCQKMTASAFSLSIALPSDGLEVTQGEPVVGDLLSRHRHHYCGKCMSWLFTRPAGMDWFVNLRASVPDVHGWFAPFIEVWTSEKLSWATTGARHSFERIPAETEFPRYVQEFAREGFSAG